MKNNQVLKVEKEGNDLTKIAEVLQKSGKSVDEIIGLIPGERSENEVVLNALP